jgi:uncharacterized protein YndB with AHSA1/START domain
LAERETNIHRPAEYAPERAHMHAVNELLGIEAPPERVWAWLTRPDLWPKFYANCWRVRHLEGPWPQVALGTRFRWITFGALQTSEIVECEPPERLAWDAHGTASVSHGLHAWLIQETKTGCNIFTEETQRGWGIRPIAPVFRPIMERYHQKWIEGLARVAAEGDPPPP